ncbi:MAG: DHHA1 domain-containing protein, partial [Gemmatimonadota bacterium]|jgi:alanyl-tRNA synthetase
VAGLLKSRPENLTGRLAQLLDEKDALESLLEDLRKGGGAGEEILVHEHLERDWGAVEFKAVRLKARNPDDVRAWGDGYREGGPRRVALVVADFPEGKPSLFGFVSDDLIVRGVRADMLVREVASLVGGKGGGRPHMAQAGIGEPEGVDSALGAGTGILRGLLDATS